MVLRDVMSRMQAVTLAAGHMCRRLDQLLKRYERGEMPVVDWLHPLALKKIEQQRHEVLHYCATYRITL